MITLIFNKQARLLILLISVTTIIFSCNHNNENGSADRTAYTIPDSLMKKLIIDTVTNCPLVNAITLTGSVDFDQDHQLSIYPPVSGIVQDIKIQVGDFVQQGQTLALVKSSEMAGYSNNLLIAETNEKSTKKLLDAAKDLFASGLSSQLDVTAAQVNYEQAVSQLEMVKRVLKLNGNNTQGDYIVKAPISGFIVQKNITNNTVIRADNGTNLFTISDLKQVWIQANVYESNIGKVHMGDSVMITTLSYPDRIFRGKVDKIINVLDPTNKVMKVRIVLQNIDYALKPLMYTSVKVISQENKQTICVSSNSLVFDNSRYYVLKYSGKNTADITPVTVQSIFGNKVYLTDGVNVGDRVIASQSLLIYDALNN